MRLQELGDSRDVRVCGEKLSRTTSQAVQEITQQQPHPLRRAKAGMKMRLLAGLWFAVTGFVPALVSFLATSWRFQPIGSRVFVGFVIIPIPIFALCGAIIGAPILSQPQRDSGAAFAALRGIVVAALSFMLYVSTWAAIETLADYRPGVLLFGGIVFYIMAIWGSLRLFVITMIGALSGWLLYRVRFVRDN